MLGTTPPTLPPHRDRRFRAICAAAAVLTLTVAGCSKTVPGSGGATVTTAVPSAAQTTPAPRQADLPGFTQYEPFEVAVDPAGSIYVLDSTAGLVLTLAAGSAQPKGVPLTGVNRVQGLAVDTAGNVYTNDLGGDGEHVLQLPSGSSTPTPITALPPNGLTVAADTAGNIYVSYAEPARVLKLAHGSTNPIELPLPGLNRINDVAADTAGNIYVVDDGDPAGENARVLRLAPGTDGPTEVFAGPTLRRVAVDTAGNIYVTQWDEPGVLKLAPGAASPTKLPFTGLRGPGDIAVDRAGTVYVVDRDFATHKSRVVRLLPG